MSMWTFQGSCSPQIFLGLLISNKKYSLDLWVTKFQDFRQIWQENLKSYNCTSNWTLRMTQLRIKAGLPSLDWSEVNANQNLNTEKLNSKSICLVWDQSIISQILNEALSVPGNCKELQQIIRIEDTELTIFHSHSDWIRVRSEMQRCLR